MTHLSNLSVIANIDEVKAEGVLQVYNHMLKMGATIDDIDFLVSVANQTPGFNGTFHCDGKQFYYE